MTLILRPAENTDRDAYFFAWGLNEAMDGLLDVMFGSRSRDIIAAASRISGHDLSLEHVIVAEMDCQIVGMFSGMPTEAMADIFPVLRRQAGIRFLRAGLCYCLGWLVFNAMSKHAPREWYLQAIAVSPEMRGSGVGSQLLAAAEEKARLCHCRRIALDAAATNAGGIRLYERLGYQKEWTSWPALLLAGPKVHRMAKPV